MSENENFEFYVEYQEYKEYKHQETQESDSNTGNGKMQSREREERTENMTGALPVLETAPYPQSVRIESPEFTSLLQSLHDLFTQDRQIASQPDTTRCGICYLYFPVSNLRYRDEGFYICPTCDHALGNKPLPMLHKQQKL